jgi:PadR family transcriptional regulator PadR
MLYKDNDLDNIVDASEGARYNAAIYAEQLSTQLKKGLLSYCVLLMCEESVYTSEILEKLRLAEVNVAEGTIYPLLARLQKDGLLSHKWQESTQGPPRKYYAITDYGRKVCRVMSGDIRTLNQSIKTLERSKK